jgi:hypothetical protein
MEDWNTTQKSTICNADQDSGQETPNTMHYNFTVTALQCSTNARRYRNKGTTRRHVGRNRSHIIHESQNKMIISSLVKNKLRNLIKLISVYLWPDTRSDHQWGHTWLTTFEAITRLSRINEDRIYTERLTTTDIALLYAKSLSGDLQFTLGYDQVISMSKSGIDIGLQSKGSV